MTGFKHSYTGKTKYGLIETRNNGRQRIVDPDYPPCVACPDDGNVPEVISGNESVSIVAGAVVVDPDMDSILEERAWAVLGRDIHVLMKDSEWMLHGDSGLTAARVAEALTYHDDLMSLKCTFSTAAEVRTNIHTVLFSGVWKAC